MFARIVRRAAQVAALAGLLAYPGSAARADVSGGDLHGVVTDSATGSPIGSAEISVQRDGKIVANRMTDAFGRYRVHNLEPGMYVLNVRFIGFRRITRTVSIGNADVALDVRLATAALELSVVRVLGEAPVAVDTRSGDQTYTEDRSHSAPTTSSSQVIQQSVAGAVRAPTGEVHIRGQHAEYTYYVDGVPVPSGVSGSLNELFDPAIVNSINFKTGGWDAEYGNKSAAIIDVTTRVPAGGFHMKASAFGGSFGTSGQSLSASSNRGMLGVFGSFSRQLTDMRREPVLFDSVTNRPYNFHNHGEDLFGFGKLQFTASTSDVVNLEGNWSRTAFEVPFDSTGGALADDHQTDMNAFVNLGWRHRFDAADSRAAGAESGRELFVGLFYRTGSLAYTPGAVDSPQFQFYPDTTPYNLREDRSFTTTGLKLDYSYRPDHELEFKSGLLAQVTSGHENFVTTGLGGVTGPASNSSLSGHDFGLYAQTAWAPTELLELRAGVRYDQHAAPFAPTQSQVSPRLRLNFYLGQANTAYLFYGRLFMPTNVEDLRAITSVAQQGVATAPTLPERDDFFEAGFIHRFPVGVVTKLSGYYKSSTPGIDDNTVPGSAIVTSVNIERVKIAGVEAVIEVNPPGPISGNVNVALNHAYGFGTITGGFFPSQPPAGFFDLDHDQRLSVSAHLSYVAGPFYLAATQIYGSGLTNGVAPEDCGCSYGRGLFDFNTGIKVKPNNVTNFSAGWSMLFGTTMVRPELFVDNLFDSHYLLKGAFFSGASVGRPRSVQFRVNVGV